MAPILGPVITHHWPSVGASIITDIIVAYSRYVAILYMTCLQFYLKRISVIIGACLLPTKSASIQVNPRPSEACRSALRHAWRPPKWRMHLASSPRHWTLFCCFFKLGGVLFVGVLRTRALLYYLGSTSGHLIVGNSHFRSIRSQSAPCFEVRSCTRR